MDKQIEVARARRGAIVALAVVLALFLSFMASGFETVGANITTGSSAVAWADDESAIAEEETTEDESTAEEEATEEDSSEATADDGEQAEDEIVVDGETYEVQVSADRDAALIEGQGYALSSFSQAKKGSNANLTDDDGNSAYYGYRYYVSSTAGELVGIGMSGYVVVYVAEDVAEEYGIDLTDEDDVAALQATLIAIDQYVADGGAYFTTEDTWYFTSETEFTVNDITFLFDLEVKTGSFYAAVIGADGSDITDSSNPLFDKPSHAAMARITDPENVDIVIAATGIAAAIEFLQNLDWSPLWVSLKTTGVAIVIIFFLGLAAAYFTMRLSPKWQNIFDSIFTIPMVLPPTVCGFVLLYLCGSKTAFGQFFINIGFPLIFSWPATVIAAVVVAFPLMYRNTRGAFESLDPTMLDAARTLGWSNFKVFVKLMLPLSWSSIAAATVLAFARALGEFGATLFLAGNYIGVTRTIPIAIYFEWMNGNDAVAWFWVAVIIVFSFVVILFINLWSKHTTRYRKRDIVES